MQEVRKIVQKGPGKAASLQNQAGHFDREWFDEEATHLKNQLAQQSILVGILDLLES